MRSNFPVPQNKHVIPLLEKELTDKIIGAAIEVHKVLGPGCVSPLTKYVWDMRERCEAYRLNIWLIYH